MADYTPLIARAVEGLERNTGENRRELYERARKALLAQLRGIDPPLDEAEITHERLALEDAIRAVEAEAVKRNREQDEQDAGEPQPPPRSLTDQALAGFRENIAEAEGLGEAAAQASKSARNFYPPDDEAGDPADPSPPQQQHHAEPSDRPPPAEPPGSGWEAPLEPAPVDEETYRRPRRSYGRLIAITMILLALGGIAAAGYWQRNEVVSLANKAIATIASLSVPSSPPPPSPALPRDTTPSQPKISDRIGQEGAAAGKPANAPAAEVAQKVVLYEEGPAGQTKTKRYVGSAIWRTETVSPGPGLAPELAVRCDVEIPERHMRMTWSFRRTDKTMPTSSHTIEIMFTLPADFPEGGIQAVGGMLMKESEQARGVPLHGLTVKVSNGFFLMGLNSSEADLARNVALLKERPWFDLPIAYNNNRRALLSVEKGVPGERAFQEAFRAWGR